VSVYFIAQIRIHDQAGYQHYLDGFDDIFAKYDGEVVVVDDSPIVLEGEWPYTRMVVIRFTGEDEARRWYNSPEYRELARHRFDASAADIVLAKGRD
jgi:uncharacterized protein (DUF1330 family)